MRTLVIVFNIQLIVGSIIMMLSQDFPGIEHGAFWTIATSAVTPVLTLIYLIQERGKKWQNKIKLMKAS